MLGDDVHALELAYPLAERRDRVAQRAARDGFALETDQDGSLERPFGDLVVDVLVAVPLEQLLLLRGDEPLHLVVRPVHTFDLDVHERLQSRYPTNDVSTEVKNRSPSVPVRGPFGPSGPKPASTACSGCGMSPTTLPRSLLTPAMSRRDPLGLCPT